MPLTVLEIRHVRYVGHHSIQWLISLKFLAEQITRQILFARFTHLSNTRTKTVAAHHSLQKRSHVTRLDRKEKVVLDRSDFFNEINVFIVFRCCFSGCVGVLLGSFITR